MRVNIEDRALADPRFARLGGRMKMNRYEAIGRSIALWLYLYQSRTDVTSPDDVDSIVEKPGFAAAMLAVGLAEKISDDEIRIKGTRDHIDFLLEQDSKRVLAKEAKASRGMSRGASQGNLPGIGPTGHASGRPSDLLCSDLQGSTLLGSVIGASAPDPGSSPGEKTSPDHQPALERFHELYFGAYGTKPTWGGKQVAMLKRLVASHTASEVVRRMEILFSNPPAWLRPPYDVGTLVQHFDKLAAVAVDPVRRDARGGLTAADLLAIAAEERAKGVAS